MQNILPLFIFARTKTAKPAPNIRQKLMKYSRRSDLVLNVAIPLLAGSSLYYFRTFFHLPSFVDGHLADGLWAYSFISSILIVWDRKARPLWVAACFLISACFELFQHFGLIAGNGDIFDLLIYYLIFLVALALNKFLKTPFNYTT